MRWNVASLKDLLKQPLDPPASQPARRAFAAGFIRAKVKDVMDQFGNRSVLVEGNHTAVPYACTDPGEFLEAEGRVK